MIFSRQLIVLLTVPLIWAEGNISNVNITQAKLSTSGKQTLKNLTLLTEGGLMVTEAPTLGLPKENHNELLRLDKEFGIKKIKPVHARKGVSGDLADSNIKVIENKNDSTIINTNTSTSQTPTPVNKNTTTSQGVARKVSLKEAAKQNDTVVNTVTEHIKKPTILSYDTLSKMDKGMDNTKLPYLRSSSNPVDQMPSPSDISKLKYQTPTARSPEFIMPIVITILVLPTLVVLGYIALKKGKEAWKNRHYKRMDFLLDGMYND